MPDPDLTLLARLREPLPDNLISKLPGGIPPGQKDRKSHCDTCGGYHGPASFHLDYAGHAAITDRLLEIDPLWSWEPMGYDDRGLPIYETDPTGKPIGMWIKLTVGGVTRLGFGDAVGKQWGPTAIKEVVGDALRNSAMRFGVGLALWHKGDLDAATGEDESSYEGPLTGQDCADAIYEANSEQEIIALTRRYPGSPDDAAREQVADPGTGSMMGLLAFARECRAAFAEFHEPLRVRRLKGRAEVVAAQDATADDGQVAADPGAVGHVETAAERAVRIAATLGGGDEDA